MFCFFHADSAMMGAMRLFMVLASVLLGVTSAAGIASPIAAPRIFVSPFRFSSVDLLTTGPRPGRTAPFWNFSLVSPSSFTRLRPILFCASEAEGSETRSLFQFAFWITVLLILVRFPPLTLPHAVAGV